METIWYILITFLVIGYVILDGFDIGVGSIYLLVAKTEVERNQVRNSIGPIWDGNEVWLIAASGTLFFAFPKAYALAFSRFYLAFFLLLWLLILRGLAIELRSQLDNPLWHIFWDVTFSLSSLALAGLLGVVLGNLLRGIPISAQGGSVLPFWTHLKPDGNVGLVDWFTLLVGGLAVVSLVFQGASYLILKTGGELQKRTWQFASRIIWVLIPLSVIGLGLTPWIQPVLCEHYFLNPWGVIFPILTILLLISLPTILRKNAKNWIFVASSLLIFSNLSTAAYSLFPNLLLSITDPTNSMTVNNSATSSYGLHVGLIWFSVGFILMLVYVGFMYRSFWGKSPINSGLREY